MKLISELLSELTKLSFTVKGLSKTESKIEPGVILVSHRII